MTNTQFKRLDNLLDRLVSERRTAREAAERFTAALIVHNSSEIERQRAVLHSVYDRIRGLEKVIMAV